VADLAAAVASLAAVVSAVSAAVAAVSAAAEPEEAGSIQHFVEGASIDGSRRRKGTI
jgi:hypothetical protein